MNEYSVDVMSTLLDGGFQSPKDLVLDSAVIVAVEPNTGRSTKKNNLPELSEQPLVGVSLDNGGISVEFSPIAGALLKARGINKSNLSDFMVPEVLAQPAVPAKGTIPAKPAVAHVPAYFDWNIFLGDSISKKEGEWGFTVTPKAA